VLQRLLDELAKEGKAEKRERNLQSAPAANDSTTAAPAPKKQKVKTEDAASALFVAKEGEDLKGGGS
jgi:hypothetical protein